MLENLYIFQLLGFGVPVDVRELNVDFACGGLLKVALRRSRSR